MRGSRRGKCVCCVALRKESVDRNAGAQEIVLSIYVALRKESVDRNSLGTNTILSIIVSLSARRAWIEIGISLSVTRYKPSRSPQGERG